VQVGNDCVDMIKKCDEMQVDAKYDADIALARQNLADAEKALREAEEKIKKNKGWSTAMDVVGIAGGVTAGVSGGVGIAGSKSIYDALVDTAASADLCGGALGLFATNRTDFMSWTDANYKDVSEYAEYKNMTMPARHNEIQTAIEKCDGAFKGSDFMDIRGDLVASGISSGVALAGAVGTGVSSVGAIAAKETEDKGKWRLASTVSSGVSGVAGVVSTVLASKVKKILTTAKSKQSNCIGALDSVKW
jgi:hypothetical protein